MTTTESVRAIFSQLGEKDRAFAESVLSNAERYAGRLTDRQDAALRRLVDRVTNPVQAETVGTLDALKAMFDSAASHLKRPALLVLTGDEATTMKLKPAKANSRNPGAIYVMGHGADRGFYFGKVTPEGEWMPSRDTSPNASANVAAGLRKLADDPRGAAERFGRLTGACCFCSRTLTDARSTAVGYGPVCAEHFGLAWGGAPEAVEAQADNPTPRLTAGQKAAATRAAKRAGTWVSPRL